MNWDSYFSKDKTTQVCCYYPVKNATKLKHLVIAESLKIKILNHLQQVSNRTAFGVSLHCFLADSDKNTDADFANLVKEIADQMQDHPEAMERILGDSFSFFSKMRA